MRKSKSILPKNIQAKCESMKPVCFFCKEEIKTGQEIVLRRESGFYHKKCFKLLFTLTSNHINT
jgi:hypothetical protein